MTAHKSWRAGWVWAQDARVPNAHVLFRKDFEIGSLPASAVLHIAVESFARVYLNGAEVLKTGFLSYPGLQTYESVEIGRHLRPGVNQLAVLAWWIGIGSASSWPKDPGLLCEIEWGGDERIGSGPDWKCLVLDAWTGGARSPNHYNLDLVENLDLRKLPEGFPFPKDESGFQTPAVAPWPGVRMGMVEPRAFRRVEICGEIAPELMAAGWVEDRSASEASAARAMIAEDLVELCDFRGGIIPPAKTGHAYTLIYRLGGYEKGYPLLNIEAPGGTVLDLASSEELTKSGRPNLGNRAFHLADRFILRDGRNVVEPEEWKTGRYLQLTFRNYRDAVRVHGFTFRREHYPLARRTIFRSSDPKLDRIVEIGLKAAALCMHDRIMDCPWRERRQWIGDVHRICLIAYHAFDDTSLARAVLRQSTRLQDATGRIWVCSPLVEEYPTQSMEWLRAVLEYEDHTGDTSLRQEVTGSALSLHCWFQRCRNSQGLFFDPHPPVFNWMDTLSTQPLVVPFQSSSAFLGMNLRYLGFLDDMSQWLLRAGEAEAAARVGDKRRELAAVIPGIFTDAESGLLRECSEPEATRAFTELSAALAVRAGLPDFDGVAHWDRYRDLERERPALTIPSSPYGKYDTLVSLAALGRTDDLVREILRCWGPMVDAGSDTSWEAFDGASQCHGFSGIPIITLMRHVLGADPRRPGLSRRENVGGVDWLECEVLSTD